MKFKVCAVPRKHRIEYSGATYHVISRGNYRKGLFGVGKSGEAFENALFAKGAAWKVEIARKLRSKTTAGNPWIAKRLKMGHPNYVSNLIHETSL